MGGDRIVVGIVASLTGQFSRQGSQSMEGAAAWVRDANSSGGIFVKSLAKRLPLQLVHMDDCSRADAAGRCAEELIQDYRVDLLLGPYSSVLTLAVAPVAEKHRRILWNHGGASDRIFSEGYRWVVGILTPASKYLGGLIDLVKETDPGSRRVALLYSGRGSFAESVASGIVSYAGQQGFLVTFQVRYQPPVEDFAPLLREIQESESDIIIGVGRIQEDLLLARQIVQGGVRAKAIALVAAGIGQFSEALGSQATGFMGPSQWEPGGTQTPDYGPSGQDVVTRLGEQGVESIDYPMVQAYAAGLVAQRCVEEAGTLDDGALREVAYKLDFTTFYGRFKLDQATGCQVGRSVRIVQWQGGEKLVVWPRELAQGNLIYPFPTAGPQAAAGVMPNA